MVPYKFRLKVCFVRFNSKSKVQTFIQSQISKRRGHRFDEHLYTFARLFELKPALDEECFDAHNRCGIATMGT